MSLFVEKPRKPKKKRCKRCWVLYDPRTQSILCPHEIKLKWWESGYL